MHIHTSISLSIYIYREREMYDLSRRTARGAACWRQPPGEPACWRQPCFPAIYIYIYTCHYLHMFSTCICVCIHMYVCIFILYVTCIYIYIEREREIHRYISATLHSCQRWLQTFSHLGWSAPEMPPPPLGDPLMLLVLGCCWMSLN